MYQIENAKFQVNTRDYLLENMEKHPLWLNALKERHPEGDLTEILKSLFKNYFARSVFVRKENIRHPK